MEVTCGRSMLEVLLFLALFVLLTRVLLLHQSLVLLLHQSRSLAGPARLLLVPPGVFSPLMNSGSC